MNTIDYFIGRSFDRRKSGRETMKETIEYSFLLGAPDERGIQKMVNKYLQEGWSYVARKEDEGFLSVGARTILTFQR